MNNKALLATDRPHRLDRRTATAWEGGLWELYWLLRLIGVFTDHIATIERFVYK